MANPVIETILDQLILDTTDAVSLKKLKKIKEKAGEKVKSEFIEGNLTIEEAYKKATVHVSNNTGKYEWYTPQKFIDAAKNVMRTIDLDPASSENANKMIKASKIYTEQDNGLIRPWSGNIWMNPPYNNSLVHDFTKKLVDDLPNINQACVLVNNATETKWFQRISRVSNAICYVQGRIRFLDVNGEATGTSLQGQVIMYFGKNIDGFYENFSSFGLCMIRMKK